MKSMTYTSKKDAKKVDFWPRDAIIYVQLERKDTINVKNNKQQKGDKDEKYD